MKDTNKQGGDNEPTKHEFGAFAGWGLMGGAALGLLIGSLYGRGLITAMFVGPICWLVGAVVDRSRL